MKKRKDIVVKHSTAFNVGNVACVSALVVGNDAQYKNGLEYRERGKQAQETRLNDEQRDVMREEIARYTDKHSVPKDCGYRHIQTPHHDFIVFYHQYPTSPATPSSEGGRASGVRNTASAYLGGCFTESMRDNHGFFYTLGSRCKQGRHELIEALRREGIIDDRAIPPTHAAQTIEHDGPIVTNDHARDAGAGH